MTAASVNPPGNSGDPVPGHLIWIILVRVGFLARCLKAAHPDHHIIGASRVECRAGHLERFLARLASGESSPERRRR